MVIGAGVFGGGGLKWFVNGQLIFYCEWRWYSPFYDLEALLCF
jgi:hypothetical protein